MRVLALSPGQLALQLDRLPALVSLCEQVGATLQVACAPTCRGAWDLIPQVEKILPFDFEASPTLADWANLLGCVREPDFQVCLNFAEGQQVNLMLSMSHIPTRIASSGFSSTEIISPGEGWCAQRLASVLKPLGCDLDADRFRLALSSTDLDAARAEQPAGEGPMLLLAPAGQHSRPRGGAPHPRWTTAGPHSPRLQHSPLLLLPCSPRASRAGGSPPARSCDGACRRRRRRSWSPLSPTTWPRAQRRGRRRRAWR